MIILYNVCTHSGCSLWYVAIRCTVCAQDPVGLQFCGAVNRNETNHANLNVSCSGSENCSEECQITVDNVRLIECGNYCVQGFMWGGVALGFPTSSPSSPPPPPPSSRIINSVHIYFALVSPIQQYWIPMLVKH